MYITEIFLQGFRNLSQLHIEPSEGINVIYGSNAQGKTNFLESLYLRDGALYARQKRSAADCL